MTHRNGRDVWPISNRQEWLARREHNLNASDIAALFHAHKFTSAFQLWAHHTKKLPREDVDTIAMRRGRVFEPAVAAALREDHPTWQISPAGEYVSLTDLRLGATPDFYGCEGFAAGQKRMDKFLVQVKTVIPEVFEDEWTPAPPVQYLFQVQCEMFVTGIDRCILAVMVLDGREFPVHEYKYVADPEIHAQIEDAVKRFWRCVERDEEPKLCHPQDAWAIARLNPEPSPDVLALHGSADAVQTCQAYADVSKQIKTLEAAKDTLGSKLKGILRNHAKAEAQDWIISWPVVPEHTRPQVTVKAHRRLTVTKVKRGK